MLLELFVIVTKKPLLGDFILKTDFVKRDIAVQAHVFVKFTELTSGEELFLLPALKTRPSANQYVDCFQLRPTV